MLQHDTNAKLQKDLGQGGVYLTSAQGKTTVKAIKILCITNASISVEVDWVNSASPQALTLVAGQAIYGGFSEITVTSGSVVAYQEG